MRWMFVSGGSWSPDSISDLVVWLDADDTAFANNDAVSVWANKGSGGDTSQSDSAKRPVFKTNLLNGRPGVDFDGSNDCLQIASLALNTFITMFVVAKTTNAAPFFIEHGSNTNFYSGVLFYGEGGGTSAHYNVTRGATKNGYRGTADWFGDSAAQAALVIDEIATANNPMGKVYRNGTVQADGSLANGSVVSDSSVTATLNIGARDNGAVVPMDGDLHELIIYNTPLATSDREKVEGYLAWKWGIEGGLPAGHPYKNAAPSA